MAENTDGTMEDREIGPIYKSLFLVACAIIGSAFGWWFTNFVSTVEGLQREYRKECAQLEARVSRLEWQYGHGKETARCEP